MQYKTENTQHNIFIYINYFIYSSVSQRE
jgi:hypothetical protein